VVGESFIGLEVAALFRAQNIEVSVVGREPCPMGKILGADVGNFSRKLLEEHGVTFPTVSSRE
jgi:apoptosis-inducing factor 3